jgi:penicillin-binding protein 1B
VSNIYSRKRLYVVLALLTIVTLPVVVGSSLVIYYYLRYSVLVERRLKGERWAVPARLYARPLVLHGGLSLGIPGFIKVLNGLKYEEKKDGGALQPGEFLPGEKVVTFDPRPVPNGATEALAVTFDKEHVKDLKGVASKKAYKTQPLEPELITYLFEDSREKRRLVQYDELPENLIKAVLAIEDRRFFSHPGLDPFRIVGAALRNMRAESYIQGGSTITQQLVKNFFLTPERRFRRKIQEALLALALERRASKKDILQLYLNEVYLGQVGSFSINGVGEAARMYFRKDVANLTLPESALLAGMIQSPNPYNPYRHARAALRRRNQVIEAMRDAGFIDQATSDAAIAQPLSVDAPQLDTAEAPYFVDLVKAQLSQRYDQRDLSTQNLSIFTTLDLHLQTLAQNALETGLANVAKLVKRKDPGPVQGCVIVIEPKTGAIVALVGGRSYGTSQYNRVTQARRQPGSTFKPFVYLTAFEATFEEPELPPITPATTVDDSPSVFFYEDKEYAPQNYEDKYMGVVTLRTALAHSLNTATVRVGEIVGYDRVANLWTSKLGLGENVKPYPALSLGAFEATPLEMATAYNVLANGGLKVDPVTVLKVIDAQGRTLEKHQAPPPPRVVHAESAFLVTNMLRSVFDEGTAAAARAWGFTQDAAGKTGTTNDMKDAWFAGYTPDLLCVVWVGFDDNQPLNLPGARAALPIWVDFMKEALSGVESPRFEVPSQNIIFVDVDKGTGLLANPSCPRVVHEAFIAGTEPHERCREH